MQPDFFIDSEPQTAAAGQHALVYSTEPQSGVVSTIRGSPLEALFELSLRAYDTVIHAEMDESFPQIELEQYIQKIFDAVRETEKSLGQHSRQKKSEADIQLASRAAAEKAASDRGDALVRRVCDAAYKVEHEIHRLMGLLRFNPGADNMWLARCAPDHFILPCLAEHFMARFGDDPWAIIDEKRGLALVRQRGEDCRFGPLSAFPFLADGVQMQDNWEDLWRHYHKTIFIENRKNPGLQRQLMPARYWKYLPEKH
ncbi:MAG: TIGR03915 family putative DNA repair protein [Treponema sp.]|jgi:probable DNA metabolism protein|nr:TIGR03915 family putative DNA repair protein [Treponema sp.]